MTLQVAPQKNFPPQDSDKKNAIEEGEMSSLPPDKDTLRVGVLERKSIDTKGIVWTERLVMLTEEICYFATIDRTGQSLRSNISPPSAVTYLLR
jgi:hypothetical protein